MILYLPDCPACMASGDNGNLVPYAGVYSDEFAHECGWTNDTCPSECSTEHDAPEHDVYTATFTCPETNDQYNWCDICAEWCETDSWYANDPYRINRMWVCDPETHGYESCEDCGDYLATLLYRMDRNEDEFYLCASCAAQFDARQPVSTPGDRPTTCHSCNTPNTYMDEYREVFVCQCEAERLKLAKKPVLLVAA